MSKEAWRDNLKSSCLLAGFRLALTRAMCEFLSAVADGVNWDRSVFGSALAFPDNWLTTSRSLEKRGLIERKPQKEIDDRVRNHPARDAYELHSWSCWRLTPAGESAVVLLKLTGLFVEADTAAEKKAREATKRRGAA